MLRIILITAALLSFHAGAEGIHMSVGLTVYSSDSTLKVPLVAVSDKHPAKIAKTESVTYISKGPLEPWWSKWGFGSWSLKGKKHTKTSVRHGYNVRYTIKEHQDRVSVKVNYENITLDGFKTFDVGDGTYLSVPNTTPENLIHQFDFDLPVDASQCSEHNVVDDGLVYTLCVAKL